MILPEDIEISYRDPDNRADIELLAKKGLIDAASLRKRAEEKEVARRDCYFSAATAFSSPSYFFSKASSSPAPLQSLRARSRRSPPTGRTARPCSRAA